LAVAPAATRPRPGGGRLFIIVGLLLAVVAFGAVFLLGSFGGGGASIGGPSQQNVVIARHSIPLRHQIVVGDLAIGKASGANGVSLTNTFANTADVVNKVSQLNISAGSVITSDMLATSADIVPGQASSYLPLAKGYVAMTIPTGEQMGVAGHISVGDYITVIVSAQLTIFNQSGQQTGPTKVVSKTVFTNLRIIGLGPAVVPTGQSGSAATSSGTGATTGLTSSLTVELTQCDAEFLTWFLGNTTVRYTLESYKDYGTTPTDNGDPTCATIDKAGGVSQKEVDARFHFTAL